jgi:C4-dicarboxylate transporter DctM subunit
MGAAVEAVIGMDPAKTEESVPVLDRVVDGFALWGGGLILFNSFIITYEVVSRFVFNAPTIWVMEVSIYCTLLSGFLSVAYALKEHAHVKVDFLIVHLRGRTALVLEILAALLAILFVVTLGWEGIGMALKTFQADEHSPTLLRVPTWIPQSFIPFGSAMLLLQYIRLEAGLVRQLFSWKMPTAEKGSGSSGESSFLGPITIVLLGAGLFLGLYLLKVNLYLGLLVLFADLLICGLPVAFALGLFGLFGFYFLFGGTRQLIQVPILAYATMDSFVMVALPLFILGASVLRMGNVAPTVFAFANVLVRHLPGGLGIASVIFCGLFAAMTGSSVAVASALSLIALPELLKRGYNRMMVIGLLAAGGTLGILFPPSIAMMLYGAMTNESIGFLFIAGVIPGLILSLMFCFYVAWKAGRDPNVKRESRATFREISSAGVKAAGGLGTIAIIMGGIYSGVFTPTESGGIACFYSVIICYFIYRTLSRERLKDALMEGARINAMIMMIIVGANLTQQIVLLTQIPQNILGYVQALHLPSWVILLAINVFLFLLGMPLEAVSILVITVPILYPLIIGFGYSGLWFAVVMVINMEMALISPPEGLNLFILQNLAKATAAEVSRGVIPFIAIMALFLVLVCFFPTLATWLPAMMK